MKAIYKLKKVVVVGVGGGGWVVGWVSYDYNVSYAPFVSELRL